MSVTSSDTYQLSLSDPFLELARHCEVHCVADCCGVDAFDVNFLNMIPWVRERGPETAREAQTQISELIRATESFEGRVTSGDFNAIWRGAECADYLRQWREELSRAVAVIALESGRRDA